VNEDVISALLQVVDALERLHVPYAIGGSIAGMLYGEVRSTLDADLVADLSPIQANDLVALLRTGFYLDKAAVARAIEQRSSFNAIHLHTLAKVDVFLPRARPFDREQLRRRRLEVLVRDPERKVWVTSAEDMVLHKLEWYRLGGEVSDRQWRDVLGILKTCGPNLDAEFLRRTAGELGLGDMLDRAFAEAGLASPMS
jgi:hypothetical protein